MTDKPKPDLQKAETPFAIKRMQEVMRSASEQKNRAKVLVYASFIENDLSELFAKLFIGSAGTKNNRLLNPKQAGSLDLASKIELAYKLGLFSHRFKTHLDMIRDFRNDCAHLETDFDFGSSEYRSRIKGAYLELSKEARVAFRADDSDYEKMFSTIGALAVLQLQLLIERSDKTKEKNLESLYIDGAVKPKDD